MQWQKFHGSTNAPVYSSLFSELENAHKAAIFFTKRRQNSTRSAPRDIWVVKQGNICQNVGDDWLIWDFFFLFSASSLFFIFIFIFLIYSLFFLTNNRDVEHICDAIGLIGMSVAHVPYIAFICWIVLLIQYVETEQKFQLKYQTCAIWNHSTAKTKKIV